MSTSSASSSTSGVVAFRPRARLLKLIGSELISDEILAITELVKNAHDADASTAIVEFSAATGGEGQIVVRDDGHGMDLHTLLSNWMEPAGTSKVGPDGRRTRLGRRVLGEKGVGRFATDKLARRLELVSRRPGTAEEIRATFDWDQFDSDSKMLSEITSHWEVRPAKEIEPHGTLLRMTGLRASWNERMFRRLSTRLSRLRSPFRGADSFAIRIESDEFPDYSGELRSDILDRAPYRIDAAFDGQELIQVTLNGGSGISHLWSGGGPLSCGPVRMRLFAFDLESEAISRIGPRLDVRAWLREWSGISVYRDGFRIWPYGEPHDDWLRLDQRRVNNPVVRLSNNQIVGFVEITRDANPNLVDQTNREGLINSHNLEDLRRLLYFALQLLEAERQTVRHPRSSPKSRGRHPAREEVSVPLAYSELAAIGQISANAAVDLAALLTKIETALNAVAAGIPNRRAPVVTLALRELRESLALASTRVATLNGQEEARRGGRRTLDLVKELDAFQRLIDTRAAGIIVGLSTPQGRLLRVETKPAVLHSILHILAANSLEWAPRTGIVEIRITARPLDAFCELIFADAGPGLSPQVAQRVFEPGFSLKAGGRGMGLTIARDLLTRNGGQIEVVHDRRRRGATFRILIPRKRSRVTARSR